MNSRRNELDTAVFKDIKTPSYVIDENKLIHNLKILNEWKKKLVVIYFLHRKRFQLMPCIRL